MTKSFMKSEIFNSWMSYPDGKFTAKTVGGYRIELFYGTNRGGVIIGWEKGYQKLEHIWTPSDDKKFHKAFEATFMKYQNALIEYKSLKTRADVIELWTQCD